MNTPVLVGVTGGIGSGKSLVCKIFSCLQVPVYYADDRAKRLMHSDPVLKSEIIINFGSESYDSNGRLNRAFLANHVFNQPVELIKLNNLVHPAVAKDFSNWVKENSSAAYLIKEAALIFESGSFKNLNYIINVSAPVEKRIKRVLKRDPFRDENQVKQIIAKQLADEERNSRSNFIINNDGQHLLIPQVLAIHDKLRSVN